MLFSGTDKPCCEIRLVTTDIWTDDKCNGGRSTASCGEDWSNPGSCWQSVHKSSAQVTDKWNVYTHIKTKYSNTVLHTPASFTIHLWPKSQLEGLRSLIRPTLSAGRGRIGHKDFLPIQLWCLSSKSICLLSGTLHNIYKSLNCITINQWRNTKICPHVVEVKFIKRNIIINRSET
jgi:hypothetical protein